MADSQPNLQLSRADLREKIQQEKQRMLREHAKPPPRPTALRCLPPLTPPAILPPSTHTPKTSKKEAILEYLRQQAIKIQPQHIYHSAIRQAVKEQPPPKVYHVLQMGEMRENDVAGEEGVSGVWEMLRSNGMGEKGAGQFEAVPMEVMRTEISEMNYNNCYFFNLLSLAPYPGSPTRFPPFFYLRIHFWLLPPLLSPLLTLDKDSG